MKIWLTEIGEPLPLTPGRRLMRAGLLAEALSAAGHDVTWWTSTFDHVAKVHRLPNQDTVTLAANYRIELLHARGYSSNHSLARMRHQHRIAKAFGRRAPGAPQPDLVYCCVPTLEVTDVAVRYAVRRGVPVVVDVRDLWPDVFLDAVPRGLRLLARVALHGQFRRAARIFRQATAIVAVSQSYLEWALRYAARPRGRWDGVFPHGYPTETIAPEELDRARQLLTAMGVDGRRVICTFVGTFGHSYDLAPVILTARRMLAAGDRRVLFVLAGDGERAGEWRALADGLTNVVFTGWLSAAGIAALMRMSSVGVAAYVAGAAQGLPNKIFEFLSAGLPVLSSLRGEAEALLEESGCGLTYSAGEAASFSAALERLLADPGGGQAMACRARARFEADFRADQVYPALTRHLESVVTAAR
ncbi:MAG TPA: glycosyltransferase family 4 protein [Gemmatimonadales bacterium]|nr:glycosyltransferase family 4 protein [Gemmatimonadales bacterium]